MNVNSVSYSQLKVTQGNRVLSYLYVDGENFYLVFLVDVFQDQCYVSNVAKGSDDGNDFEQNIKPTATLYSSIDDGIADQISKYIKTTLAITADSIASVTNETFITFNYSKTQSDGTLKQVTGVSNYAVSPGKSLLIFAIIFNISSASLTPITMMYKIRSDSVPPTTLSPIILDSEVKVPAGATISVPFPIPGGIPIAGGNQIGITQAGGTGITTALTLIGTEN